MAVTVYTTSVSADKLVKKHQQFILDVLTSKGIQHREIDISSPENDLAKQFMRANAKAKGAGKVPVPPQVFAEDGTYLGDYDDFVEANEADELHTFLKLPGPLKPKGKLVAQGKPEAKVADVAADPAATAEASGPAAAGDADVEQPAASEATKAEGAPAEQTPVEQTEQPAEQVPVEQVPDEQVPVEQVPAEQAPAENMEQPAEKTQQPAEKVPPEQAPAEEATTAEGSNASAEPLPADEPPAAAE